MTSKHIDAFRQYSSAFAQQSQAFQERSLAAHALFRSMAVRARVTPSYIGMTYVPYNEFGGNPDQVMDSSGNIIYGPFITNYLNTTNNYVYDNSLTSLTERGAFISRYHTAQFAQFDYAVQDFQNVFSPPSFATTPAWMTVISNTTFILENFNERLNLINTGVQGIFGSTVFTSDTQALNYVSNTNWPNGFAWVGGVLPLPLDTSNTVAFQSVTYYDDANVIGLNPMARAYVEWLNYNEPASFQTDDDPRGQSRLFLQARRDGDDSDALRSFQVLDNGFNLNPTSATVVFAPLGGGVFSSVTLAPVDGRIDLFSNSGISISTNFDVTFYLDYQMSYSNNSMELLVFTYT